MDALTIINKKPALTTTTYFKVPNPVRLQGQQLWNFDCRDNNHGILFIHYHVV